MKCLKDIKLKPSTVEAVKKIRKEILKYKTKAKNKKIKGKIKKEGFYIPHWWSIRNSSKTRNIKLNIKEEEAFILLCEQENKCALSGVPITLGTSRRDNKKTASLDRIDSSKPYTKENLQWIHKDLNKMKNSYDQKYFIEFCKLIALKKQKKKIYKKRKI